MSDSYESIKVSSEDGITTVFLSRPEKLNAYTPEMGAEVVDVFRSARDDESVRAIILTGEGRGFCAGVDLDALKASLAKGGSSKIAEDEFVRSLPLELLEYPKPVIAAINGAAIGVGVTMVLPCDMRIAAEGAKLGIPFTKLGITPGLGSTHLLPRLVGMGYAQELALTSRVVLADEALSMGLVNRVVPPEKLLDTAREMAALSAQCDPNAVALAKQALWKGTTTDMAGAMENERAASKELMALRAAKKS